MRTRTVVALVVGVLAVFVLIGVGVFALGDGDDRRLGALQTTRAYAAGRYAIAGPSGWLGSLSSYEGCRRKADVSRAADSAGVVRKQIAGVLEEPCILRFRVAESAALWSIVDGMLDGTASAQDYTLVATDFNYKVTGGVQLVDAVPTRFVIPRFDAAASKDPVTFELWLQPASLLPLPASELGSDAKGQVSVKQKAALLSSFRFELGTLPMSRVSAVGPIEVRSTPGKPTETSVGDVDVTMSTVDAAPVHTWFDNFVIKGQNGASDELTGKLALIDPSSKNVLAEFILSGVGIIDVFDEASAGVDKAKRTLFSVYAEELALGAQLAPVSPQAPPPPPPPGETTTTAETTPTEEIKLEAPAEIRGSASGRSEVELSWSPVEGADSYVILAALGGGEERPDFNELAESREASIVIGDLRPGTYLFVVRARSGETESADSPVAEIVVE